MSSDCGETWLQRKVLPGSILSPLVVPASWVPSTLNDWTTIHLTNLTPAMMTSSFRYKFTFQSNEGNNIYIDDINIYNGAPSDNIVLGIAHQEDFLNDIQLYPNPGSDETYLRFQLTTQQDVKIAATDLMGKTLSVKTISGSFGDNLVVLDVSSFSAGTYYFQVQTENGQKTIRFVKH